MFHIQRVLRVILFIAASCLVVNDCARLVFSFNEQYLASQIRNLYEQDQKNEVNAFSFFEEEVKHKELSPGPAIIIAEDEGIETYVGHLIEDDEVRHLAYIPIFSPPPNLA